MRGIGNCYGLMSDLSVEALANCSASMACALDGGVASYAPAANSLWEP